MIRFVINSVHVVETEVLSGSSDASGDTQKCIVRQMDSCCQKFQTSTIVHSVSRTEAWTQISKQQHMLWSHETVMWSVWLRRKTPHPTRSQSGVTEGNGGEKLNKNKKLIFIKCVDRISGILFLVACKELLYKFKDTKISI